MGKKNRFHGQRSQRRAAPPAAARGMTALERPEKPRPVVYGKPFMVLEDPQKKVFVIQGAQLVPHEKSIAAYRQDSQVKELPQKIKGLTRYEICSPIGVSDGI